YPELIIGQVTLTSENPPVTIFPKSSGNIELLLKQEGDTVQEGDLICVLGNTSNFQQILNLEFELNSVAFEIDSLSENHWDKYDENLGEIQSFFVSFKTSFKEYKFNLGSTSIDANVNSISTQISELTDVTNNLMKIKRISEQEFVLIERAYLRFKKMHEKGFYSDSELEANEMNFLKNKRELENINIQINTNNIAIEQLKRQQIDLVENKKENDFTKRNLVIGELQRLQSEILKWKDKNLIYAPINGVVSMNQIRGDNEYINSNRAICTIIPIDASSEIIAISRIPINKTGKLTKECPVNIKFYNYPYKEFGIVSTTIRSINILADEGLYTLVLNLPNPIITSYGIEIPYTPEMKGQIEIVLEKQNLFEKLRDEFNSSIQN
ncbi:MAG: HlyD family efflux transporter periplasmic adaptor subunit, partial [Crocinitomix sp.]|nr:HlyD family efflux transporter periplasmic adaptor subunit [Crocinitomix sp.]